MNTELFELCKEVYEKTGWDAPYVWYEAVKFGTKPSVYEPVQRESGDLDSVPAYTSDFLLEKLPTHYPLGNERTEYPLHLVCGGDRWKAYYNFSSLQIDEWEPTPLKALLKLCLALYESGELK